MELHPGKEPVMLVAGQVSSKTRNVAEPELEETYLNCLPEPEP
jgi:hypothetical protein